MLTSKRFQFEIQPNTDLKLQIFPTPPVLNILTEGGPSEFCHSVQQQKTRMTRLQRGKKPATCLALLTEVTRVRDRQKDRQNCCSMPSLHEMHSAVITYKKIKHFIFLTHQKPETICNRMTPAATRHRKQLPSYHGNENVLIGGTNRHR